MPFTEDDFDPQLEQALELMPQILGDEGAEIRYAINGLLSLTPDGAPVLGETPEVKGLWSAAAVWIKEGPGVGRALAEWMTDGLPEVDLGHSDIARFYPHQRTRAHIRARTGEAFNKTYGIVHPGEQWESDRRSRLSPMYADQKAQGAVFFEAVGWERPHWYESNAALLEEYGDRVHAPRARVGLALVVADHQRRAPGDARPRRHRRPVGVRDLRRRRPRRTRRGAADRRRPGDVAARPGDLHPRARRARAASAPTSP